MVKISEESEQKEFVVCKGSEFARVGRKGIIFKLSTETLLLTFASDEVGGKKIRQVNLTLFIYPGFQPVHRGCDEDKN